MSTFGTSSNRCVHRNSGRFKAVDRDRVVAVAVLEDKILVSPGDDRERAIVRLRQWRLLSVATHENVASLAELRRDVGLARAMSCCRRNAESTRCSAEQAQEIGRYRIRGTTYFGDVTGDRESRSVNEFGRRAANVFLGRGTQAEKNPRKLLRPRRTGKASH